MRTGSLLYLRGHGPLGNDRKAIFHGKLGRDLPVNKATRRRARRRSTTLVTLRAELGSLDRVRPHRQGAGHGQRRSRSLKDSAGDQRFLGPDGGSVRREHRQACPLRGGHGDAPHAIPSRSSPSTRSNDVSVPPGPFDKPVLSLSKAQDRRCEAKCEGPPFDAAFRTLDGMVDSRHGAT